MSTPETTTVARLNELLDMKDRELAAQVEETRRLQRHLDFGVDWMLHQYGEGEEETLPVPRIQFTLMEVQEYHTEASVDMVLPQRGGGVTYVPVGYGKRSGAPFPMDKFPLQGPMPDDLQFYIPTVAEDAYFLSDTTGLPCYLKLDSERVYKVETLRPLKLVSVAG